MREKFVTFTVNNLKEGNLVRHEKLTMHKQAVASFLKLETEICGAPSQSDIRDCWDDLRSGTCGDVKGAPQRSKSR
jgi:hypothetical protein